MQTVFDVTSSGSMLTFGDTVSKAIQGYAVVFIGLLMLMAIVYLMGTVFKAKARRVVSPKTAQIKPAVIQTPAPAVEPKLAPGAAGEVKRFDVPDKEAAMIMAIVADAMGKPLNELRFQSIKEVKNDEV